MFRTLTAATIILFNSCAFANDASIENAAAIMAECGIKADYADKEVPPVAYPRYLAEALEASKNIYKQGQLAALHGVTRASAEAFTVDSMGQLATALGALSDEDRQGCLDNNTDLFLEGFDSVSPKS